MKPARLALAVLISGRGSNMLAIARACAQREMDAQVVCVGSDRADAPGLDAARGLDLEAFALAPVSFATREAHESALSERLDAARPDLVILAGYMRILGAKFVAHYRGRMLNIHPSLLPKFKGLHTHRRAIEAGETEHGCSVHFVTEELDGGPVVLQGRIGMRAGEDAESLSARGQAMEHILYSRAIGWMAAGRLVWHGDRPWLDGQALAAPVLEDFDAETC